MRLTCAAICLMWCGMASGFASDRIDQDLGGKGWSLWVDDQATWQNDELFLPPVDLAKVPVHAPTGGWERLVAANAKSVSVPGTVEQYAHRDHRGPSGDITGVSWWFRELTIPAAESDRRVVLRFGAVRQRAEIYLDHQLVGYELVGNSPFEVDLTGKVAPGTTHQLALRITDPGGNFDWRDFVTIPWGKYQIPSSHGFGGILGAVGLRLTAPVHISDVYVQNQPDPRTIKVLVTVANPTATIASGEIDVTVRERLKPDAVRFRATVAVPAFTGERQVSVTATVPDAALWDLDHPNLYVCEAALRPATGAQPTDRDQRTFGFRWFAPEEVGQRAVLRLNGKRIVLRTAISWGYWPLNGLIATPDMAERQIRVAKQLGLNMLNHHRGIGDPVTFEKADELGLLYFEEPGGHVSPYDNAFAQRLAREKLLRMVKRDRSHPSLIIYNLINEQHPRPSADHPENQAAIDRELHDLRDAHALDPSRTCVYTSAWSGKPGCAIDNIAKAHLRPFDPTLYFNGWYDQHRAGGPQTWLEADYKNPKDHYGYINDPDEIVYWGEEGALSAPPRVELIKNELAGTTELGWDSGVYVDWFNAFDSFLTRKNLRGAFSSVDALTASMGLVSFNHQGRKIEVTRICDDNDGYAINGWESEVLDNHSGIVDVFRYAKGDPAILAHYNQPCYVAVKPRTQFAQPGDSVAVDFFAVNEIDLRGAHTLHVELSDPAGTVRDARDLPVTLTGGDTYGQLLAEAVTIPIAGSVGMYRCNASLRRADGAQVASGREDVLVVDWRSTIVPPRGAVYERDGKIAAFLKAKQSSMPAYADGLNSLDWVVVARTPKELTELIPASALRRDPSYDPPPPPYAPVNAKPDPTKDHGLTASYFLGTNFDKYVSSRTEGGVNLNRQTGEPATAWVPTIQNYTVRWTGTLIPPVSGTYKLGTEADDGVRLTVDGKVLIDRWKEVSDGPKTDLVDVTLEAGKAVTIRLDYVQFGGNAVAHLVWQLPEPADTPSPERLLARAHDDGATILIIDRAETWVDYLTKTTSLTSTGWFKVGGNWLGGQHVVKRHPLFADLPVDQAMDWPYQAVLGSPDRRLGLRLEGEELVVGNWHSYPFDLGTAVGVIPYGKGKIVLSTLDVVSQLDNKAGAAHVARKVLCNYLNFAGKP